MAPQRKNTNNDDSRNDSESIGTTNKKDKTLSSTGTGVSKGKKGAGSSSLKTGMNASDIAGSANDSTANGQGSEPGDAIKFPDLPRRFLHSYRNAHHLSIPSSFSNVHNQAVLSDPSSIGLQSPTMARPREKRRVSKDALARAVRRDFMDQSVNELDVEASACYIIRNGDRAFRWRFLPPVKK